MNLTVATKVRGGFLIISLLLIILSISSLISLNSVESATDEVNNLAIPTLSGSSNLKASFLNMGRLTFEAFIDKKVVKVEENLQKFQVSKENFDAQLETLRKVLAQDQVLRSSLSKVEVLYDEYSRNALAVFENHAKELSMTKTIESKISEVEENADDASSLLLDFTYLDEVENSPELKAAAVIANKLESNFLSFLTVITEYVATDTVLRATTRGKELDILVKQVTSQLADLTKAADGKDTSGTIPQVTSLVNVITSKVSSSDGIVQLQIQRLESYKAAEIALTTSDKNISDALVSLESLLSLANKKATASKESVSSSVSSGTNLIIGVVIVSLIIATAIAIGSVRAITVPLAKVNELLKIASSGDLTHRLDDSSRDEFGVLAKNCNMLIGNLKSLIVGINQRASQLAAASGETSAVTAQTTNSIQEQKSQISQIAAATTEMHSTAELVSQSADDTLSEIRNADKEAEKVKQISVDNKRTIEVLARDVQDAADVINKLHQDSASIGGILDVIRGVADQTNLLALNAAIEAARAGEQGRGFAVVADEVRTLASRTQQSTQEINAMIEVLQAGAEKAVSVMNQGKEQTEVCVQQTETATKALDLITDAVHRAHEVSTRIEHAAKEQHTVSAEISERLESIVGIAEETTLGAEQTTASSAEVAKLAEELQGSIDAFKV